MSVKQAKTAPKNSVHFTLQGKGGVGKSLVSSCSLNTSKVLRMHS